VENIETIAGGLFAALSPKAEGRVLEDVSAASNVKIRKLPEIEATDRKLVRDVKEDTLLKAIKEYGAAYRDIVSDGIRYGDFHGWGSLLDSWTDDQILEATKGTRTVKGACIAVQRAAKARKAAVEAAA
jgi:hypothetical protein